MNLKTFANVRFVKSISRLEDKPKPEFPEIVIVGRSNVGKSSLINALFNRKKLAHISTTPGKTQLINYYNVNDEFYIVDLPGYGYARLAKKVRQQWPRMIETYLLQSRQIRLICLLLDARHPLQIIDQEMILWLQHHEKSFLIVLTKIDKLSRGAYSRQKHYFRKAFPDHHVLEFSINGDSYREALRKFLLSYLNNRS
jgi:GTP-binding protein